LGVEALAQRRLRIAVIGGGWAGCTAAVLATQAGHRVHLFEATRQLGGRARGLPDKPAGNQKSTPSATTLDNGQHLLIGAYTETLALMRSIGLRPDELLYRQALKLQFADGTGFGLPPWSATWLPAALLNPLAALCGIAGSQGWSAGDKGRLLWHCLRWQASGFACASAVNVAELCAQSRWPISPKVMTELIEPLCLSALNTPPAQASASVFLRVLHDALLGGRGSADLLIPRVSLSALFPNAAAAWLQAHGARLHLGRRIESLTPLLHGSLRGTLTDTSPEHESSPDDAQPFDRIVVACPPWEALRLLQHHANADWLDAIRGLRFEAIATVYAHSARLAQHPQAWSMRALRSEHTDASTRATQAQFVFNRAHFFNAAPAGELAFVLSAASHVRALIAPHIAHQAAQQLGLPDVVVQKIVIEKRATFACTPGLQRPSVQVRAASTNPTNAGAGDALTEAKAGVSPPVIVVCGDYVQGAYPATIEGAVRSAQAAVALVI
jgi:hydroxysqualene dehydroxylase